MVFAFAPEMRLGDAHPDERSRDEQNAASAILLSIGSPCGFVVCGFKPTRRIWRRRPKPTGSNQRTMGETPDFNGLPGADAPEFRFRLRNHRCKGTYAQPFVKSRDHAQRERDLGPPEQAEGRPVTCAAAADRRRQPWSHRARAAARHHLYRARWWSGRREASQKGGVSQASLVLAGSDGVRSAPGDRARAGRGHVRDHRSLQHQRHGGRWRGGRIDDEAARRRDHLRGQPRDGVPRRDGDAAGGDPGGDRAAARRRCRPSTRASRSCARAPQARRGGAGVPADRRDRRGQGDLRATRSTAASGRTGPFVAVNCAALPRELVESELFGYARGAHSQAAMAKPGIIEQAEGGTLFLDEIGEMAPELQTKLLRFTQDRMLSPVGGVRARHIDTRIIAATSRTTTPTRIGQRRPARRSGGAPGRRGDPHPAAARSHRGSRRAGRVSDGRKGKAVRAVGVPVDVPLRLAGQRARARQGDHRRGGAVARRGADRLRSPADGDRVGAAAALVAGAAQVPQAAQRRGAGGR